MNDSNKQMKLNGNFIRNNSGFRLDLLFSIPVVLCSRLDVVGYNRPWWRAGRRCGCDRGVAFVTAVAAYDGPGWRTGVGDGGDCGGSWYDGPRWGSSSHSGASRGVSAIVVLVFVLFQSFDWPWRWT